MAEKTRRLKFYLLSMISKSNHRTLNCVDLEAKFQAVVDNLMKPIGATGHKAALIDLSDGTFVIELVKQEDHVSYLKLGINNPVNSVALRDSSTLEANSLRVGPNQSLEIYTFCIIDFETRVLSYVGMNGSPRVSIIKDWLNRILFLDYYTTLALIYSPDILSVLSKKKRVTTLKVDIAIPSDSELENIGVSEPTFDELRGKLTRTVSYVVRAGRGKSLIDNPSMIETVFRRILHGVEEESIELLKAYGKNEGEINAQPFDLLDYGVTVSESINRSDYDTGDDESRMKIIRSVYNSKKEDLLSFIRV